MGRGEAITLFVGVCSLKRVCIAISLSHNVQIIDDKSKSAGKSNFICVCSERGPFPAELSTLRRGDFIDRHSWIVVIEPQSSVAGRKSVDLCA